MKYLNTSLKKVYQGKQVKTMKIDNKIDKDEESGKNPRSSGAKRELVEKIERYAELIDNSDLSAEEKDGEFRSLNLRISYEFAEEGRRIPILLSVLERDAQKIDSRDSSKRGIYVSRDLRGKLDAMAEQRRCSTNNLVIEYLLDGLRQTSKENEDGEDEDNGDLDI